MSIEQMQLYEEKRVIDSPTSLKACKVVGVLP